VNTKICCKICNRKGPGRKTWEFFWGGFKCEKPFQRFAPNASVVSDIQKVQQRRAGKYSTFERF